MLASTSARRSALVLALLGVFALPASGAPGSAGANGSIAFTSTRDGNLEIYSANPDGTGLRNLTNDPGDDQTPAWSPDGRRIAFGTFRSESRRQVIYVMNADGTGQTRLSPPDSLGVSDDRNPTWSPDGRQIAFESSRPFNQTLAIWAVNVDRTGLRQVSTGFGVEPAWSPDGTKIAYVGPGSGIYVMGADGSSSRRITAGDGSRPERNPEWSPDGRQIVFARSRADWQTSNVQELFVIDADGATERQLTESAVDSFPAWSPDGAKIVFGRQFGLFDDAQLYVIGTELGSVPRLLFSGPRSNALPDWGVAAVADTTPPSITVASPADGAVYQRGAYVLADYSCSDEVGGSGVTYCSSAAAGPGQPIDTSPGTHTFAVKAEDAAGNVASQSVTYTVLGDVTPPRITITTPGQGDTFTLGQSVAAAFSCRDDQDGPDAVSCTASVRDADGIQPVSPGGLLDTASVGAKTFTVVARDRAGNESGENRVYYVVFDFAGFASPVANLPELNVVKAGQGIPVRFSLRGSFGPAILADWGSPYSAEIPCDSGTTASFGPPTSGSLSYNASLDRYTYLWQTEKAWAGTCRQLVVVLADGTAHRASFKLAK